MSNHHDNNTDDHRNEQVGHTPTTSNDMSLALIEEQADKNIRRVWHEGQWYFSVIDVIALLTESPRPRKYWSDLKASMRTSEGWSQLSDISGQLKMLSPDGKSYRTDAADTQTLLRIIQSIPSPKAEPVKQWLARVGAKRLDEATRPLESTAATVERNTLTKPDPDAPALDWAMYYEQLAALYRRQATYEARLATHEIHLRAYGAQMFAMDERLEGHEQQIGELHSRMEGVEEVSRIIPEILERLGPQLLTSEHQNTVRNLVKRLSEIGAFHPQTIYVELTNHFHVAKYDQLPEARWLEVAEWFQRRIEAAEKRQRH